MRTGPVVAAVGAAVAVGIAGCSTAGTSSSSATSSLPSAQASSRAPSSTPASSAVCRAADDLRASLDALAQVDVVKRGTGALQESFAQVKTDLTTVAATAQEQYSQEVQKVQSDAAAVQAAVNAAKTDTTAQTLGAVASAVRVLVKDGRALVADVAASC